MPIGSLIAHLTLWSARRSLSSSSSSSKEGQHIVDTSLTNDALRQPCTRREPAASRTRRCCHTRIGFTELEMQDLPRAYLSLTFSV